MDKLFVQIALESDPARGTFVIVARGMPLRDGKMVEWRLEGKVAGDKLELGKPERR
jgi:hypothetical protein